jgi:hypothetical protein
MVLLGILTVDEITTNIFRIMLRILAVITTIIAVFALFQHLSLSLKKRSHFSPKYLGRSLLPVHPI